MTYGETVYLAVHSVVETPTFLADAKDAGMGAEERQAVILYVSMNPQAGDIIAGTGGARKLRFQRPGSGKRGGYRVIFYFAGENAPLFLLNVFSKGDRSNLSKAEQNALRTILSKIVESYRPGVPQ